MNIKFRNFIFNGLAYGLLFFALSFIIGYYSFHLPLRTTILTSASIGIPAFIINGLIQSRFTKSRKILQAIKISLQDFETIKMEAPANHMIDEHLVSGKLFLTEKQLIFKSAQQKEYAWPIENLHSFKFHPSIFNTGGEFIITVDKQYLVFEVDEIKGWKRALVYASQ